MKLDLLKEHKADYAASQTPVILDIAPATYLSISGTGAPGGEAFQAALGALYSMAYRLKFQSKAQGRDFGVCKLEAVYGVRGQAAGDLLNLPKECWKWDKMIRLPDFISFAELDGARAALREAGKPGDFDAVVHLEQHEGQCVQALHLGPFSTEHETIQKMHEAAAAQGLAPHSWHREIYLSDPRRVPEERLRTLIRHPVRPTSGD